MRATALMALVLTVAPAAEQPASLDAVLASTRAYLAAYKDTLGFVLADEAGTQRILRQVPGIPGAPSSRNTRAEIHFRVLDDLGTWMAIRNVTHVDGALVEQRADLKAELEKRGLVDVASDFKTYNSRFNIGGISRNFNEPTLALGLLDAEREATLAFEVKDRRTERGVRLVTLAFREHKTEHPFVMDLNHAQAPVEGEFVVEESTGVVRRSRLKISIETGPVKAELATTYGRDEKLDLWVPITFRETYESGVEGRTAGWLPSTGGGVPSTAFESIYAESKYSNYRRFQAVGRIK